ncbi:MAG: DUF6174 domain-containing protein [Ignavibacteriaceae bacterium]
MLISCHNLEVDDIATGSVEENFSSIKDPEERWQAYNLKNYTIEEVQYCECLPPNKWNTIIANNIVEDVKYEISKDSYYSRTEDEIYNQTKKSAITIEEAFELIKQYKNNSYRLDVKYNIRFGYPERIFIDIDSLIADEEIIREFSNLKKTIN